MRTGVDIIFNILEILSFGSCELTGRQNDSRDKNVFENAGKRRPCAHSLRINLASSAGIS
jgi:hypothetical protein